MTGFDPHDPQWDDLSARERELGMDRSITRRDFFDGLAIGVGAAATAPWWLRAATSQAKGGHWPREKYYPRTSSKYYPPSRTGLRGQFEPSSAIPHALRDAVRDGDPDEFWDRAGKVHRTNEAYDLVVVGGGISGLAAAYLYRQQAGPDARILVLETLDDFGGHARRNEFTGSAGRFMIGYGGAQSIDSPSTFSPQVTRVLEEIGVITERFYPQSPEHPEGRGYFDPDFNSRNGFSGTRWTYFDHETFGRDALASQASDEDFADFLAKTPLDPRAQADLLRLEDTDFFPGLTSDQRKEALLGMTYKQFLEDVVGAHPDVVRYYQKNGHGLWALGIDCISALDVGLPVGTGVEEGVYPGMAKSAILGETSPDPYIFHFPEGNGGVARLLARALVPDALPGSTMEDAELSRLRYNRLDRHGARVKIRLGSPAVRVRHLGDPRSCDRVEVAYIKDSKRLESVTASNCILATYQTMMPYLCDEFPAAQREAMLDNVRVVLMYSNVQIRSRDAFRAMNTSSVRFPGSEMMFDNIGLDFAVSMGGYEFPPASPSGDDPCILHVSTSVNAPGSGLPPREQARAGRRRLAGLSFRELELRLRDQMARGFEAGGFDPASDIEGITINRWAHGYAYEYLRPWDTFWPDGPLPIETARQPFGRIAIANSDSGAFAYTQEAIDQAYRAVQDLVGG